MSKHKNSVTQYIKEPYKNKKPDKQSIVNENYPLFCFKYLSDRSIKKCKDFDFFINFILRLKELSNVGWHKIRESGRHHYGMEPIPTRDIIPQLPDFITPDITHLHVFRATRDNLPFIGLQVDNIFRILFIETKFGDIYNHRRK
jgi:hypothetical protein